MVMVMSRFFSGGSRAEWVAIFVAAFASAASVVQSYFIIYQSDLPYRTSLYVKSLDIVAEDVKALSLFSALFHSCQIVDGRMVVGYKCKSETVEKLNEAASLIRSNLLLSKTFLDNDLLNSYSVASVAFHQAYKSMSCEDENRMQISMYEFLSKAREHLKFGQYNPVTQAETDSILVPATFDCESYHRDESQQPGSGSISIQP